MTTKTKLQLIGYGDTEGHAIDDIVAQLNERLLSGRTLDLTATEVE